jgi:hypothetical protein
MAIDRIPGVGPTNADIATAVAAPSAASIATAVAAAVPTLAQINTSVTNNGNAYNGPSAATIAATVAAPSLASITSAIQANAGGKTRRALTLTSGSSWTVPAGVTFLNVTLYGGGGGSGAVGWAQENSASGGTGGTTTFTGATSATGGTGGGAGIYYSGFGPTGTSGGTTGTDNTGLGGIAQVSYSKEGNPYMASLGQGGAGSNGQVISSTLTVTPSSSISYSIGAGGTRGNASYGRSGGSGKIDIEYWV